MIVRKSRGMRRAALSAALVTVLAGVAACGSTHSAGPSHGREDAAGHHKTDPKGSNDLSAMTALRTAARSTDKAESATVESTMALGSTMSTESKGTLDWSHGVTGNLTLTYTGGAMAEQLGDTAIQARYLPDAYYANLGEKAAQQTGGKHWIRYAYQDLADLAGGSGAYMKDQMQNSTPNESVRLLLASGDVKKVGEEKVRGQDTTHYSGEVDITNLAAETSDLTQGQLADLKRQLKQAGISTETVDIWVDADDLLVKKKEVGQTSGGRMSLTAYYSDYGVKVSVQEPPASDTADFKEMLKSQTAT